MAKFIEVHKDGIPVLVNLDKVDSISYLDGKGAYLVMYSDFQYVDEKYEKLKMMVGEAQGGIPLDPSKMY